MVAFWFSIDMDMVVPWEICWEGDQSVGHLSTGASRVARPSLLLPSVLMSGDCTTTIFGRLTPRLWHLLIFRKYWIVPPRTMRPLAEYRVQSTHPWICTAPDKVWESIVHSSAPKTPKPRKPTSRHLSGPDCVNCGGVSVWVSI